MLSSNPTMTTTISEPTADQTTASTTTTQSGPTVFVGNLAFSTTADQITDLFGAEKVKSVRMIKKFGRFKGYGFVSFATQKDADQAVADWNGKETNGREIKVQPATEPKPVPVKPVKPASTESDAATGAEGGAKKSQKKRKPRKPKKRVDEAAAPAAEEPSTAPASSEKKEATAEKPKRKNRKPRRPRKTPEDSSQPAPNQTQRKPRPPRVEREFSKTSLFVGNLPYEVDDEDLKGLFADFKVENARVVRYNERSKGYGFVYFADEQNCAKAKADFEGALLESRALIVKYAYKED